ncbi:MAG: hypothetical protein ACPGGN_06520, partial [Opitutales bacterium]
CASKVDGRAPPSVRSSSNVDATEVASLHPPDERPKDLASLKKRFSTAQTSLKLKGVHRRPTYITILKKEMDLATLQT